MAALKRMINLSKILKTMTTTSRFQTSRKTYFTYVNEPSMPILNKEPCWLKTADEAIEKAELDSDQLVFVQGAAATPTELLRAMTEYGVRCDVRNVKLFHMHLEGDAPFAKPENATVQAGHADCIPIFLHEIPRVFNEGYVKPDIALIHVSPPDDKGYCSLGTSVDCVRAALSHSKYIVALINKCMPRTFGDALIHVSHLDFAVEHHKPLPVHPVKAPSKEEQQIELSSRRSHVTNGNRKYTGCELVEKGCITNNRKTMHRGRIVGSFCVGSDKLYNFMHNNPFIEMLVVDYVNDPKIVAKQPNMTAINSCIEVDITGQICSDSIGTRMYSGFGGQLDFITGAALSDDRQGRPIIALQSVTSKGESKIQPVLKTGAGVVTNRAVVRYIVTEYGIASLFGKSLQQRSYELIQIAHPDHREALEKAAFERLKLMPAP
ncbi:4-hydroxybutyrate coenzyme A transferase [Melipona quadrifasciata]|uniref:4-hydroxybutyrate coenzyme A transferase n=1 Tax=Melipona quadrifasciata TaxID=166423 RepID=A0A0M8ZZK2_9HYME|nr:4-hydroxybutyrate coenzyme A transferase [Melipona quadrifasciata]